MMVNVLSEDEALMRAIQMSLDEQQTSDHNISQQYQEDEDLALARALQESEREEQQRRARQQVSINITGTICWSLTIAVATIKCYMFCHCENS